MQTLLTDCVANETAQNKIKEFNILVLDDDEFDRERLKRLSQKMGFRAAIRDTASLAEFKASLDEDVFDIAIIDYRLPEGDGIEAVRFANDHARNANIATIMIAGDAPTEIVVEAMKAGFDDYLSKANLSPQAIRQAIFSALERSSLNREDTDADDLRDTTYQVLKAVSASCFEDMRPVLSRMLRKLRRLGDGVLPDQLEEAALLADLDASCLQLCTFIDDLDRYANSWKSPLH